MHQQVLQHPPFPSPGFGSVCSRSSPIWHRYMTLDQPRKTAKLWGRAMRNLIRTSVHLPCWAAAFSSGPRPWLLLERCCLPCTLLTMTLPCWPQPCLADPTSWLTLDLTHYYGLVRQSLDCWLNLVTRTDLFCSSHSGEAVRRLHFLPCCPLAFCLNFPCEAAHSWCSLIKTT